MGTIVFPRTRMTPWQTQKVGRHGSCFTGLAQTLLSLAHGHLIQHTDRVVNDDHSFVLDILGDDAKLLQYTQFPQSK
jgi:hypothetical protein